MATRPLTRVQLLCAFPSCQQPFDVLPHQATAWKYCSPHCYRADRASRYTAETFANRFWQKVARASDQECWLWQGATHANGYGNFRATPYKQGNVSAHVVSWFLSTGAWPEEGLFVLHTCDRPPCVNPQHLFLGTHTDNMQDSIRKGRHGMATKPERAREGLRRWNEAHPTRPTIRGDGNGMRLHPEAVLRGDKHPSHKITDAQVHEASILYASGQWTLKQLSIRYNITIQGIRQRLMALRRYSQQNTPRELED